MLIDVNVNANFNIYGGICYSRVGRGIAIQWSRENQFSSFFPPFFVNFYIYPPPPPPTAFHQKYHLASTSVSMAMSTVNININISIPCMIDLITLL